MSAPQNIQHLIRRFHEQREMYLAAPYKETQVRIEFIDPLFKALGWDIDNSKSSHSSIERSCTKTHSTWKDPRKPQTTLFALAENVNSS